MGNQTGRKHSERKNNIETFKNTQSGHYSQNLPTNSDSDIIITAYYYMLMNQTGKWEEKVSGYQQHPHRISLGFL